MTQSKPFLNCCIQTPIPDAFSTKQNLQSGEIAVSGDQWPLFVYANEAYDPEDPWNGLLRSRLLVNVSAPRSVLNTCILIAHF
jgi:hypothetical protein